jgi:hypothetical protein
MEEGESVSRTAFELVFDAQGNPVWNSCGNCGRPNLEHELRSRGPALCPKVELKVFITMGEHPSVPGVPVKVFASQAGADEEAASLVNIIRSDSLDECPKVAEATAANWGAIIKRLAKHHGKESCWVEVTVHEVHS